jgi:hexulose-6-phosphate isomerase
MRKSINAWSVEDALGMEATFEAVKSAGFDGIELNLDNPGQSAHSLTFSTTPQELAQIKALSTRFELPVVSVSSSLWGAKKLCSPKPERQKARALLLHQLECARALDAKGILVVPGGISVDISIQKAYGLCQETLAGMRADIEAAGLFVGVENVWNGFFHSPFDMARFIDELDCPYIGAYYDVGNVVAFSWTEHWIEILGRRIGLVHVKDFKRNGGIHTGGAFVDLLQGDVAWPQVVAALQKAGFDGYLTAEVFRTDESVAYPSYYRQVSGELETILAHEKGE